MAQNTKVVGIRLEIHFVDPLTGYWSFFAARESSDFTSLPSIEDQPTFACKIPNQPAKSARALMMNNGELFAQELLSELQASFGKDLFACIRYLESRFEDGIDFRRCSIEELFLRFVAEFEHLRDIGLVEVYRDSSDKEQFQALVAKQSASCAASLWGG